MDLPGTACGSSSSVAHDCTDVVDQGNLNGSGHSESVVPFENNDASRNESDLAKEIILSDSYGGESYFSDGIKQASSGCEAEMDDEELASSGEISHDLTWEKTAPSVFHNLGNPGFQSAEGGHISGRESSPLTLYCDNLISRPGVGDNGDRNGGIVPDICTTDSPSVDGVSIIDPALILPNNLPDLANKLSEPLGMAVATVFYEVLEPDGGLRAFACPVDELSKLLEAALNESLVRALGDERTVFVGNFKNSFRSTYMTIRSVRRIYSKIGPRLTSSRQSYTKSWKGSSSRALRKFHSYKVENSKNPVVDDRGVSNNLHTRVPNCRFGSISKEDNTSFYTSGNGQQDVQSDAVCDSSDRSCLNESLQSSFFTFSDHEQDRQNDNVGSSSKSCLAESLESSGIFSNPEQNGSNNIAKSSTKSLNKRWKSPPLQLNSDANDVQTDDDLARVGSKDVDIVLDTNCSESSDWVMVSRNEFISSSPDKKKKGLSTSFETGAFKQRGEHATDQSVQEEDGHPMKDGRGSMPDPGTVGSSGSLNNHTPRHVLKQVLLSSIVRDPSGGVISNRSLEHPSDSLLHARRSEVVTLGASEESEETSFLLKPIMVPQDMQGRRDFFGKTHSPQGENGGSVLIHRRPGQARGDIEATADERQTLLRRYVQAQETKNYLKSLKVTEGRKRLAVKEDHLRLKCESNSLKREQVDLSRSKAEFKEFELEDRKLAAAHQELSRTCADELVAGLFLMLLALSFSAWKFSSSRLSKIVTMCENPVRQPQHRGWFGTHWVYDSLDAFAWHLKSLTCEITKAGRMLAGLILIAFFASTLFRRSVASSSQAMPATIIVVVLAGLCGFAGKLSIDSLGGDGLVWVFFWEFLCSLHAFATCCTPWLYKYLHGPSSKFYRQRSSFWLKLCSVFVRFSFHTLLVVILPLMAGLLPFASPEELCKAFWDFWEPDIAPAAFQSIS